MRITVIALILTLLSGCSTYQPPTAQDPTASTIHVESLGFMKHLVIARIDGVLRDNNMLVGVTGGPRELRITPGTHILEVQALSGGTVWSLNLRLEVQPARTYYLRGSFEGFLMAKFTAAVYEEGREEPVSTPASEADLKKTPNQSSQTTPVSAPR